MDCNGGAEKKTYMTTITLEMKPSAASPSPRCETRSNENGAALKDEEKPDSVGSCKGQFEMIHL